jgi:hypothetical protein
MTNLYLSGSGGRTTIVVGLLKQLDFSKFERIYAISGSALATFFCLAKREDVLADLVMKDVAKYSTQKWINWEFLNLLYVTYFKSSFYSLENLTKLMKGLEIPKNNELSKLTVCVYNISDSKLEFINGDHPKIIDYVLASLSIAGVYPPVLIDGKYYNDPSFKNHFAFEEVSIGSQNNVFVNFGEFKLDTNNLSTSIIPLYATVFYSVELLLHKERLDILRKSFNKNYSLFINDMHLGSTVNSLFPAFGKNISQQLLNDDLRAFSERVPFDSIPGGLADLTDENKVKIGLEFGTLIGKSLRNLIQSNKLC